MADRPPGEAIRLLRAFVETHAGLRFGSLFGAPAAFAGRRAFARVDGQLLSIRVPAAGRDFARRLGAAPAPTGRGWMRLPRDLGAPDRLGPLLELAARAAARREG